MRDAQLSAPTFQVFSSANVIDNYLDNKNLNSLETFAGAFAQSEQGNLNMEQAIHDFFMPNMNDHLDLHRSGTDTSETAHGWEILENFLDTETVESQSRSTLGEKGDGQGVRAITTTHSDVFPSDDEREEGTDAPHMVKEFDDRQSSVSSDESWTEVDASRLEEDEVTSLFSWVDSDEAWSDTEPKVVNDRDVGLIFAANKHMVFKIDNDTIYIEGEQPAKVLEFLGNNVTLTTMGWIDGSLSLNAPQAELLVQADSARVVAPIVGAGVLVKTGQGTVVLKGDNTYAGGTDIRAGTIQIDHAQKP